MRVLITGGCGFIGQYVARRLTARGHEVVALDLLHPQVHLDPYASRKAFPGPVVEGDVAESSAWEDALHHGPFDAVIHLAAETGTGQSMYEIEHYRRVNIQGTRLAGRFALEHAARLVSLSSRAVYGEGDATRPMHEDDPHAPVSVYGETKSEGEAALGGLDVPVVIIRPQNVVGPGQALHNPYTGVLAAFLARLREERPLTIYGDGSQTRDFLHVDDLARTIVWSLDCEAPTATPLVLNAGTGTRTTLIQLAEAAIEGAARETPIEHLDVTRAGDIDHACADLARGQALGAPEPTWSSHDAIVDFIRWSWDKPGASSQAWDQALGELAERGLVE